MIARSFRFFLSRRVAAAMLFPLLLGAVLLPLASCRDGKESVAAKGAVKYHCPMHPTVVRDAPGECPICHMTLVPIEPTGASGGAPAATANEPAQQLWTCPMHPQIVRKEPGTCPICHMDLVPARRAAVGGEKVAEGFSVVEIDPARTRQIGLRVAKAERSRFGGEIRTTGRVAADETRIHHVHTKYEAYVEELYADFTGKWVKAGEPLVELYSPELLAAQEELLLALRAEKALSSGPEPSPTRGGGADLVASARQRLRLLDVSDREIDAIASSGKARRAITLSSPISGYVVGKSAVHGMKSVPSDTLFDIADLSRVWVVADVYESDLPKVRVGQAATMNLTYWPGSEWKGRVAWIEPTVDPKSRTVKVRLDVANPKGELKPEMFANVVLETPARDVLTIPDDAVIESGLRAIVFVERGEGRLEPREIATGLRSGGRVEVVSGIQEGESVATGASFLIDSESRLRAAISAMGGATTPPPAAPEPEADSVDPPPAPGGSGHEGHRK
jgi:Cu(I)/Ag(I) efflux system membrane fusion protein